MTATCKSKTHRNYADAMEGLYIQAWIAHRDLTKLLEDIGGAPANATDSRDKGTALHLREHELDAVTERIAFGKRMVEEATREVNRHFDRGCRNVPSTLTPEPVR